MAQSPREQEADRVEDVFKWALAEIGLGVISDGTKAWAATPSNKVAASYSTWKSTTKKLVKLRRSWLVDLAVAYYRLTRALRTGRTVPGMSRDRGPVSIESLRNDFDDVVDEIASHAGKAPSPQLDPGKRPSLPALRPEDDNPIKVDDLDREWESIFHDVDKEVDEQLDELMDSLGTDNWKSKFRVINKRADDPDILPIDLDEAREEAHKAVGRRTAAELERISLLYARSGSFRAAEADKYAIGWVRYSTTGTPCGWCAMLISRGPVYKSRGTASNDMDRYHTNCKCVAVPVFSAEQYDNSPLFDLNREYSKLWPKVTKGLGSGKDALTAWRRYFRAQQKQAAQEAA